MIAGEYQKPASKRANPCRADEIIINTFMIFFVYLYGKRRSETDIHVGVILSFFKVHYISSSLHIGNKENVVLLHCYFVSC